MDVSEQFCSGFASNQWFECLPRLMHLSPFDAGNAIETLCQWRPSTIKEALKMEKVRNKVQPA
jgi:hypothetical protein